MSPDEREALLDSLSVSDDHGAIFDTVYDELWDGGKWQDMDFEGPAWVLVDGGKPENRDVLRAMQSNAGFWSAYWHSSTREGHHTFVEPVA